MRRTRNQHFIYLIIFCVLAINLHAQDDITLKITRGDQGTAQLSWNIDESLEFADNEGLILYSTENIANPDWQPVSGPGLSGSFGKQDTFTITGEKDISYFRLIKQILPSPSRGSIVSSTLIKSYTAAEILEAIEDFTGGLAGALPIGIDNGVDAWEVHYQTPDLQGNIITASGVVFIPQGVENPKAIVSYQHGTIFDETDAPSNGTSGEFSVGLFLAGTRYICFMSDYLGFGASSEILHPYLHSESEASACLDMLRAGEKFLTANEQAVPEKLFLVGYSQGGHASMALQREIEINHPDEFQITASAPMAGPQSMSQGMYNRIMANQAYPNPFYLAYLLISYDQAYDLFKNVDEYVKEPYAALINEYLTNGGSDSEINGLLPSIPNQMFHPDVLQDVSSNPDHPFRVALAANDTYAGEWQPVAPIRMYHCTDDEVVPFVNSSIAQEALVYESGPEISVVDPRVFPFFQDGSHVGCITWALLALQGWIEGQI